MRRIILFFNLFLISFFCFAQQNLPAKIIGIIPAAGDKKYQIQVGAYKFEKNARDAALQLRNINLQPAVERFHDFTRVLVKEIPANQVRSILSSIAGAGFMEVIIREDTPSVTLPPPPKQENNSGASELLCKTWKIDSCPYPEFAGYRLCILNDGTYYVTNPKGESSSLSNWRWNRYNGNGFEYTHNDWKNYSMAEILYLTYNSFILLDTGYSYDIPGRSSAGYSNRWVFSPVSIP